MTRRRTPWIFAYLAAAAACTAAYFAVAHDSFAATVLYSLVSISPVAAIAVGVHRKWITVRAPWILIAIGAGLFTLGDVASSTYLMVLGELPFPGFYDAAYLLAYPFLGAGVLILARRRGPAPGAWADTAYVTIALGSVVWLILGEPSEGRFTMATVVGLAYPLMDILLVGFLARLLYSPRATASDRILAASLALLFVADFIFGVISLRGGYVPGDPIDVLWLLSYALLGVAALRARETKVSEPPERNWAIVTRMRIAVMSVAVVTLLGAFVWSLRRPETLEWDEIALLVGGLLAMAAIAMTRLSAMARRANASADDLEISESRYRGIIDNAAEGIALTDATGELLIVNAAMAHMFGYADPEAMLAHVSSGSQLLTDFVVDADATATTLAEARPGLRPELHLRRPDGTEFWGAVSIQQAGEPGSERQAVMLEDVTARRTSEAGMVRMSARQNAIARLTGLALEGRGIATLLDDATATVRDLLGVDFAGCVELTADRSSFVFRTGAGWPDVPRGGSVVSGTGSQAGYTLMVGGPVIVQDYAIEARFNKSEHCRAHGVLSGLSVPIRGELEPSGVMSAFSSSGIVFLPDDVAFLVSVAGVVGTAMERDRSQAALLEAEQRYRGMVENAVEAIYRTSLDGAILEANSAMATMLGFQSAESLMASGPISNLYVDSGARDLLLRKLRLHGSVTGFQTQLRHVSGRVIWVRVSVRFVYDDSGAPIAMEGILADVSDQVLAERQQRVALAREREVTARLLAVDEMKNSFLTAVSHELRTPLTSVLGFSEILETQADQLDPAQALEMTKRISFNARRLQTLLGDLLDVDRLARGALEPNLSRTELAPLIERVAESCADQLGGRVRMELEPIAIEVDGPMVERIVENLLTNAVRYAPGNTPITVLLQREAGGARIIVADQGPGVADDLKTTIFEPFRQGAGVHTHSPGVGIGLSLVERFTKLHRGTVHVEDADPSGARFVVSLPDGRSRWRTNDAGLPAGSSVVRVRTDLVGRARTAIDRPAHVGARLPA